MKNEKGDQMEEKNAANDANALTIKNPGDFTIGYPRIENLINCKDHFVDQTPNGGFALRILRYFRMRCDERWMTSGLSPERSLIYDKMNEDQLLRAKELDEAIAILSRSEANPQPSNDYGISIRKASEDSYDGPLFNFLRSFDD